MIEMLPDQGDWIDEIEKKSNLSRSQFLIWLGQKLEPESPLYNQAFCFWLKGPLDVERFRASFARELASNDAMRITISETQGVPWQSVRDFSGWCLEFVDLIGEAKENADQVLQQRAEQPFDMTTRLFDSALYQVGTDEFVWFLNQHHLITDAWSTCLIFNRVTSGYHSGESGAIQPAFLSYVDQQRVSPGQIKDRDQKWRDKQQRHGFIDFFSARADSTRPESLRLQTQVDRETANRIRLHTVVQSAISEDLGLLTFFLTLLSSLVANTSRSSEFVVGIPVHNRLSRAQKQTPGLFIEVLPLRVPVSKSRTFLELAGDIKCRVLELLRHGKRGISTAESYRQPEVVLNFVNQTLDSFSGFQCQTQWMSAGAVDSSHKLRLQVHDLDASGGFTLLFDLNRQLFDDAQGQLTVSLAKTLLANLIDNPKAEFGALDLRQPAHKDQMERFNSTQKISPEPSLLELVERQMTASPGQVAVWEQNRELSYQQLMDQVSRCGHWLLSLGVMPGQLVPVLIGKRTEALVIMLGCWRIGASYVPLNVAEPAQRLKGILEDLDVSDVPVTDFVLVDGRCDFPELANTQHFSLEQLDQIDSSAYDPVSITDTDCAYVIYTSGSTGEPKGVVVSHGAIKNYLCWARDYYGPEPLHFPVYTILSVDLTVTSLYLPLLTGGCVYFYPETQSQVSAMTILEVMNNPAVNTVKLTPSHLALIAESDVSNSNINQVIIGGEMLRTSILRTAQQKFHKDTVFYNEYGPTECAVACMIHRYEPQRDQWTTVPIGEPIANTQIHVLSDAGGQTPQGVTGELSVSGAGLADGYLNRPELNKSRFPFSSLTNSRIYRTGDLACWAEAGQLELLGRKDDQIKLRGVRVEPAEIAAALERCEGVQNAVVSFVTAEVPETIFCAKCGMPSNHPDVVMDSNNVCSLCVAYDEFEHQAQAYFRTYDDLKTLTGQIKGSATGRYDCLVLFSGGKDSSYMLYQLVALGLRPLTLTLDNGYISDGAKSNIQKAVNELGVDHRYLETPHMGEIFADSLKRFANVCNGCFKTIYTLSMRVAREEQVGFIFTGLSRGQIFETRLHDLFRLRIFDVDEIEERIISARKVYHHVDDAVRRRLDVKLFSDDNIFQKIQFVDFYRYCDVPLEEIYRYLDQEAPWVRPSDTGRSTNCLINDAGIYIHKNERGYHNYALPYSWDVRLGHKQRTEALDELNDEIDTQRVRGILKEIGYKESRNSSYKAGELRAYFTGDRHLTESYLIRQLANQLPKEMIPTRIVWLENLPLHGNGKLNTEALPDPDANENRVMPETDLEKALHEVWAGVLGRDDFGVNESFFDVGGHSLPAIQVLTRISEIFEIEYPIARFFDSPSIREMGVGIEQLLTEEIDALSDEEVERLWNSVRS